MANHKSAKKRIIRNANRALINGARIRRIRTFEEIEVAIASGDAAAREALRTLSRVAARVSLAFCQKYGFRKISAVHG